MVSWSTILSMLITLFNLSWSTYERCQDIAYDVKVVPTCPTSKEERDIAARSKNCSNLAAVAKAKNCTIDEAQPEYHCLINALENKLIEVCTDKKTMFGYCTEFNEGGRFIQNHEEAPCYTVSPKCDDIYISSDAYKYTGCYKLVIKKDLESGNPELGYEKIIITTLCFSVVFLIGLAVTVLLCKRRKEKAKKDRNIPDPEHQNLMETAKENSIKQGTESKLTRQYLYCKAEAFPHFEFVYNQILEYNERLDIENDRYYLENVMPKNVIIRIELLGKLTDDDRQLLPRGRIKKKKSNDESIWSARPMICFQYDESIKSALEIRQGESACHTIVIESVLDATDSGDDSITGFDQKKKNILNAITSCLEQPLCHRLQKWLDIYSECTNKVDQIMAFRKMMLGYDENTETPKVLEDNQKCIYRRSDDVECTRIRKCSSLVPVNKEMDEREPRKNLKEMYPVLKEGVYLLRKGKYYLKYTGSPINRSDDRKNAIALTTSHEFTKQSQNACKKDDDASCLEDFSEIDPNMHQTVDNQKGEQYVGFEGYRNRCKDPENKMDDTKTFKVWNYNHSVGRVLAAGNFQELKKKVIDKFNLSEENIRLVINDGCIIDDEDVFHHLKITELFFLKEDEDLNIPYASSFPTGRSEADVMYSKFS